MWSLRLPIKVACTGNAGTRVARGNTFTVSSPVRPAPLFSVGAMRRHRAVRLRVARRLRRRAPRRLRRSSSAPGRALGRSPCAARPMSPCRRARPHRAARAADDADAGPDAGAARDAAGGGDAQASVADDGAVGGGAADGADDGDRCAERYVEAGRVASRPGCPAEPAKAVSALRAGIPRASARVPRAARCCPVARFDGVVAVTALSSSRRRCALRSSRCSPRSPWPAAPTAGIASARRSSTPCTAGAGFAVHRLAHRVMQSRPHKCGQRRRRFRRRAAHDPVQLPLHSRPLTRRGGSDVPLSPAPISRTSMPLDWPSRPPGRPWFSHRNAPTVPFLPPPAVA